MTHKFKVGDLVMRVGCDHHAIPVGGVARITKLDTSKNGQNTYNLDVGGEHKEIYFGQRRTLVRCHDTNSA